MVDTSIQTSIPVGILVDDAVVRGVIGTSLELMGLQAVIVPSASAIVQVIEQNTPRLLIISEAYMAVCRALRANSHTSTLPILACLPPDESTIEQFLQAGVSDCYITPIFIPLLARRISTLLHVVQSQASNHASDQEIQAKDQSLRETERLYRNLFESATDSIMMVAMADGKIVEANDSAAVMLGYTRQELLEQTIFNLEVGSKKDSLVTETITIPQRQQSFFEQNYYHKNGTIIPVESHSRIIRYQNQAVILYFSREITQRKRALQAQQDMRLLAEHLRDSAAAFNRVITVREVLDTIIEHLAKIIPSPCTNLMLVEGTNAKIVRWKGYDTFGISDAQMSKIALPIHNSQHFRFMRDTREPILINDTLSHGWNGKMFASSHLVKSYMGAPLVLQDKVYGFLNLDGTEVNAFRESYLQTLQAFANQAAIAIQNAQLFEQIQQDKLILEEHVAERTVALVEANHALRQYVGDLRQTEESLDRERTLLKTIIDSIADMIYVKDREGHYVLLNQAAAKAMGGKSDKDIIGQTLFTRFDKDYAELHAKIDAHIVASGEPIINMKNTMVYADGSVHHQLLSKQAMYDKKTRQVVGIVGINRDITQLEITEKALREEREQLTQVLMSARCLLWSAVVTMEQDELQWDIHIVNEAAAQALLPLDTSYGTYSVMWQKSILPEDAQRRQYVLRTHLQFNRRNFRHEVRCQRQDGEILDLAEDIEIHEIASNQWRLVGVCTDITERKRAESNLQEAYDELDLRVQVRTAELVSVNKFLREQVQERQRAEEAERQQRLLAEALNRTVARLNSTFDRDELLGYLLEDIEHIIPHQAANILLLEDNGEYANVVMQRGYKVPLVHLRHRVYSNFARIIQDKGFAIIDDMKDYPDWPNWEDYAWIKSNLCIGITNNDRVIGFMNLESDVTHNFTPQHAQILLSFANQVALAIRNANLVEQIRNYTTELEQKVSSRTAQLRAIFESMREGLIFHDMQDHPQYVNPMMIEMFGYSNDEWLNNIPKYENMLVSDDLDKYRKRAVKIMKTNGYINDEIIMRRKDNSTFDASITRAFVTDDNDHTIGTVTLIRDISQAKQLQEQRERFIANASHELRTPIANIKTRLYLLKRKPESLTENLDIAMNATNWLQRLVDDMFDLARFQRGTMELKRELVTINQLVQDIISFQEPEAERKGIRLTIDAPSQPIEVYIDPYRVMQVLSNLVSNALHYTPDGGEVRVKIAEHTEDNHKTLVMLVSDNGPGIAPKHIDNLFKPFYRASNDSRGAGLGLSISQEIVILHGGTIRVTSELGKGTHFIVELPRIQNPETQPEVLAL
jgi:two-component system phosphate regulon sensor histidine kinase PhoR